MSEVHPDLDHEQIKPELQVSFEMSGDLTFNRLQRNAPTRAILEPIELALLREAESLKSHCVIRDDIPYQEALDLTIWQGGSAFGMLRYPDICSMRTAPEYEIAEQYFLWTRCGNGYVGQRLEIRLWGLYLPDFIAADSDHLREIQASPAALLTSPEILPGRYTGYIALYQMQRPPTSVDIGRKSVSALYKGENAAARAALGLAEV
jgi:hypothetical protein